MPLNETCYVFIEETEVVKAFKIEHFNKYQDMQLELFNEFSITNQAKKKGLQGLPPLNYVVKGPDYIGLSLPKYEMTLRDLVDGKPVAVIYLSKIFIGLAQAISTLHELGYCHRDLKPDNVCI